MSTHILLDSFNNNTPHHIESAKSNLISRLYGLINRLNGSVSIEYENDAYVIDSTIPYERIAKLVRRWAEKYDINTTVCRIGEL